MSDKKFKHTHFMILELRKLSLELANEPNHRKELERLIYAEDCLDYAESELLKRELSGRSKLLLDAASRMEWLHNFWQKNMLWLRDFCKHNPEEKE